MSTPVGEHCPVCGNYTTPTDRAIQIDGDVRYFVKLWRYICPPCGWVWANEAQRAHNQEANRRARRDARRPDLMRM